jgi:hypothetical protein
MHKLCNVQKTCLPEPLYLVDLEDRELRVSEFNIHLIYEPLDKGSLLPTGTSLTLLAAGANSLDPSL